MCCETRRLNSSVVSELLIISKSRKSTSRDTKYELIKLISLNYYLQNTIESRNKHVIITIIHNSHFSQGIGNYTFNFCYL